MSAFELPDKFCCCSLKEGGKFVGTICIIFSTISCILLLIYLCSDFDAIAKEIADNSEEMVETLQESKVLTQLTAGLVLVLSVGLFVSSIFLLKGIKEKSQKKLVPFLVALVVSIFLLLILSIVQFEKGSFFGVLTLVMVFIYFFICIYALYKSYGDTVFEHHDTEFN